MKAKKKCVDCGELRYVFSKGRCKSCATKTYKKPRNVSDKQHKRLKEYSNVRKEFLSNLTSTICKVCKCNQVSDIHHCKGRLGDLLTDTRFFLPVCRECHKMIEEHPEYAYEMGYSIRRNIKLDDNESTEY